MFNMTDLKRIGDAGDSTACDEDQQNQKPEVNPVAEMTRGIRKALQCGDHGALRLRLSKLNFWRSTSSPKDGMNINYWRVAQYIGETELNSICVLLSVTCDKPDVIRWTYLEDALGALSFCLCNREVIFKLQAYSNSVVPILISALDQDVNENVTFHALSIIAVVIIVCREQFAKNLFNVAFLDRLVNRIVEQDSAKSAQLLKKVLEVIKCLLMCGQTFIQSYSQEILCKLHNVVNVLSSPEAQDHQDVIQLYHELARSTEGEEKAHSCAQYWTKGKLRKDLLSEYLQQPWLYVFCSWRPCGCQNDSALAFFRKCGACNTTRYCSRSCQEKHWAAGHAARCKPIPTDVISVSETAD